MVSDLFDVYSISFVCAYFFVYIFSHAICPFCSALFIDFWGWNFHKDTQVAKGTVIGGEHTGGLNEGSSTPTIQHYLPIMMDLYVLQHMKLKITTAYPLVCNFVMKMMYGNIGCIIQQQDYL